MRKLTALVSFIIKELNFVAAENINSFHVFDDYKPSGQEINNHPNAICIYDQVYSAVIIIERFPVRHPPQLVFGLLACWLHKNDSHVYRYQITRGGAGELLPLENPDINTTEEGDDTLTIEIIITFREPVFGIADNAGVYEFNGKKYRLADITNPAENFEKQYIINAYDSNYWKRGGR
ncbi:Bacteriophage tail completion protein R [uncultured Caudovirales phage]|uniref:Bacteriophage tail completion protein R n=1 Tax=uncultured Caudovirales phage TaxID=2100421 RepID=A0A6J5RV70_9CAUD|nr:Bacteriophage tail completion protein R [uncultured Caudovirales phage]CAB4202373.1 Bacteriophage tail completion protein R [uncultured Caudovirales phage]